MFGDVLSRILVAAIPLALMAMQEIVLPLLLKRGWWIFESGDDNPDEDDSPSGTT